MSRLMRAVRLFAVVLCGSIGAPVLAQVPAAAPDRAAPTGTDARFAASIYGAYGDPQLMGSTPTANTPAEVGADTDLFVNRRRGRLNLQLAAATGMRRFDAAGAMDGANFWSHVTTASLVAPLTDRTQLGLTAQGGYSEFLSLDGWGARGEVASAAADHTQALDSGVARQPTARLGGGAQLTRTLSTRSSILLTYDARASRIVDGPRADTIDQHGQIAFANQLRQRAVVRVAYALRHAEYGFSAQPRHTIREHTAMLGFDRQWVHSPTRQSILRVSVGPSLVVGAGPSRYAATADVSLDTRTGQSWVVSVGAYRATTFVDGIPRPFLSEAFRGEVRGRLGRRLDVAVAGDSTAGAGRFDADPASLRSRGGRARVGLELSRAFTLFGEYVYRWYELAGVLPEGTAAITRTDRGSIRAGLTWQLPVRGGLPADAAR
ncbi:MAG TPA: hypothetical protein VK886_14640 [Vicinamibacterales bacterium]|nr:hypothetical protein [Vicinamibacterales bacterium]